jgi:hypothetical protein
MCSLPAYSLYLLFESNLELRTEVAGTTVEEEVACLDSENVREDRSSKQAE